MNWQISITERDYDELHRHLFRADRDEHAAFLYAGLHRGAIRNRLLVRRVVSVRDEDFVPSERGAYRAIRAKAIARSTRKCAEEGLCLIWAHSHPRSDRSVGFSPDDLDSHARAHPAMIDMTLGRPVTGLVLGEASAAAEVWVPGEEPVRIESLRVIGRHIRDLRPRPVKVGAIEERFDRQALLFGGEGQAILRRLAVCVVGAGGGGSLIVQSLAHLGVGRIRVIDFDQVSESNLSRIVGSVPADADERRPKVEVLKKMVARIDPGIVVETTDGDVTYAETARLIADADAAFLATDTILARYAFNAVVHQFLIPGFQVGAKVTTDPATGIIEQVHVMNRPLLFQGGCLSCAGVIPPDLLKREQESADERAAQNYVGDGQAADEEVEDPSVITLNSISVSLATTDFLFAFTGLFGPGAELAHRVYYPLTRELRRRPVSTKEGCRWCNRDHRYAALAAGDLLELPLRKQPPTMETARQGESVRPSRFRRLRALSARILSR